MKLKRFNIQSIITPPKEEMIEYNGVVFKLREIKNYLTLFKLIEDITSDEEDKEIGGMKIPSMVYGMFKLIQAHCVEPELSDEDLLAIATQEAPLYSQLLMASMKLASTILGSLEAPSWVTLQ